LRNFEALKVGDVMEFGPVTITAADIKSFASRFDPEPMHLDEAAVHNTIVSGLFASGLHMGSPSIEEIRYLAPLRAGDSLTLRLEVVAARPSWSRPEMGLVSFRSRMVKGDGKALLEMSATLMFGRRAGGSVLAS
jgi:acyl dehydratase